MEELPKDAPDGSRLLIFFSGHASQQEAKEDKHEVDNQDECTSKPSFWVLPGPHPDNQIFFQ
jgi:hypothetical protein